MCNEDAIPRIVLEPRTLSGDLPGPGDVLPSHAELADDPQWAVYLIGSEDGDLEVDADELTLAEAEEMKSNTKRPRTRSTTSPRRPSGSCDSLPSATSPDTPDSVGA